MALNLAFFNVKYAMNKLLHSGRREILNML